MGYSVIAFRMIPARPLAGLELTNTPGNDFGPGARILGAWQLGYGTEYGDEVRPGQDWLAYVWREPGGRIGSFGRWRHHREHLGLDDDKVFYGAGTASGSEAVARFNRAARQLSREWRVPVRSTRGLPSDELLDWMRSLDGVAVWEV